MEQVQLQQISQNKSQCDNKTDDSTFGKTHNWTRLSLILITYVLFVLTLGFNFLQSLFWTSKSGTSYRESS